MMAASASPSPRPSRRRAPRSASPPGRPRSTSSSTCSSAGRWTSRVALADGYAASRSSASTRSTPPTTRSTMRLRSVRESKRYKDVGDFTIEGLAASARGRLRRAAARHRRSLARQRPRGQEAAARDQPERLPRRGRARAPTRSVVAWCSGFGPDHAPGGIVLLAHLHGERARDSRATAAACRRPRRRSRATRALLAFEAGRKCGVRVNTISAGPFASRAASAIGIIEQDGRLLRRELAAARAARRDGSRRTRQRSSPARSRRASPAPRCTSTRAITRWAWRSTRQPADVPPSA